MAAFNFHRRRTRHWWLAGTTLVVAALFTVFFVVGASANLNGSTFESGDGNLVVDTSGHEDWANAPNLTQQSDKIKSTSDNAFGQGTKEDNPSVTVVSGSIPPNKSDLSEFYTSHETGTNGDTFLYLAWERSNVLGNANMDFEVDQQGTTFAPGPVTINRTPGDLLFTYDFGGSGTPQLAVLVWLTGASTPAPVGGFSTNTCFSANSFPCWGDRIDLTKQGSASAEGAINTTTVLDPILSKNLPANTFGEMGVDLSLALPSVFGSDPTTCESLSSSFLTTRSSSSFTSEIKDFIAPVPVSISNCGHLLIYKKAGDTQAGQSGATFSVSPGQTMNGSTDSSDDMTDLGSGYYCLDNLLLSGSYTVAETQAPPNYDIPSPDFVSGLSASAGGCPTDPTTETPATTFTDPLATGALLITKTGKYKGCSSQTAGSAIIVGGNQIGICGPSTDLTTAKLGGAVLQLMQSGSVEYTTDPTSTSTGQVCIQGVKPGTYTLHESTHPSGYSAGSDVTGVVVSGDTTCAGTGTSAPATATVTDSPLTTITVSTTPEVSGSTTSTVKCASETTAVATPHTTGDLVPGTYTCTVVIDP